MTRLTLRPYQEASLQAHYGWFAENPTGNPLFVLPTGSGKSILIAEFIRQSITTWPSTRVLVLTHVKELIAQNHAEFVRNWSDPDTEPPCGIYSAGIGRRDTEHQVLFAGIQSIYKRARELGWFDLVLVDEAHLVPHKGMGRYRKYLEGLHEINPRARVCGYTATHYRLDGGYLHKGKGRIFTDVAYEVGLAELVADGYLVPPVSKKTDVVIDTYGIATVSGEFNLGQLEKAALEIVESAVDETVQMAREHGRNHWLVFGAGVEHAKTILELLRERGVDAEAVFGDTPKDERAATIERFRAGGLTALVNMGVLTTGFNAPCCDLMAVMRPTKSTALYVQIMGRGMRTYPGKEDCLVLDFGDNVLRHGPINDVHPRAKGEGPAPMKICPECFSIVALGARMCPDCGYLWPWEPPAKRQTAIAGSAKPFDPNVRQPRKYEVDSVRYLRHEKRDSPDSLCVEYRSGLQFFREWVCFEHEGYVRTKAARWWLNHCGAPPVPETVSAALDRIGELSDPARIVVQYEGKYDRVLGSEWVEHGAAR